MSYQNTWPKTIFGDPCSFQECNNSVKVCVKELSSCFFPSFLFGDSITFGSSLGNISNPMSFVHPRPWTVQYKCDWSIFDLILVLCRTALA